MPSKFRGRVREARRESLGRECFRSGKPHRDRRGLFRGRRPGVGAGDVPCGQLDFHEPGRVRFRQHTLWNDVRTPGGVCHPCLWAGAETGASMESASGAAGGICRQFCLNGAPGPDPAPARRAEYGLRRATDGDRGAGPRLRRLRHGAQHLRRDVLPATRRSERFWR